MSVIGQVDIGAITAYADAVNGGYTGTKQQWEALMASYATVAQQAAASAELARQHASSSGWVLFSILENGTLQEEISEGTQNFTYELDESTGEFSVTLNFDDDGGT